jgi:hypothetical protein
MNHISVSEKIYLEAQIKWLEDRLDKSVKRQFWVNMLLIADIVVLLVRTWGL